MDGGFVVKGSRFAWIVAGLFTLLLAVACLDRGLPFDDLVLVTRVKALRGLSRPVPSFLDGVDAWGHFSAYQFTPRTPELLAEAPIRRPVTARTAGYITAMPAERIGRAVVALGGGRLRQEDPVDPGVGIRVLKRPGDAVAEGETVLEVLATDAARLKDALEWLTDAFSIGPSAPALAEAVLDVVRA